MNAQTAQTMTPTITVPIDVPIDAKWLPLYQDSYDNIITIGLDMPPYEGVLRCIKNCSEDVDSMVNPIYKSIYRSVAKKQLNCHMYSEVMVLVPPNDSLHESGSYTGYNSNLLRLMLQEYEYLISRNLIYSTQLPPLLNKVKELFPRFVSATGPSGLRIHFKVGLKTWNHIIQQLE
jgi:hypothetical protein